MVIISYFAFPVWLIDCLFFLLMSADTPSQRVQFILGTEDDDEEHIPHDLFTELDELSFYSGQAYEWKEMARWGNNSVCVVVVYVFAILIYIYIYIYIYLTND